MAVTIAAKKKSVRGNERTAYVDITGPASYTTGGEALSQSDLNLLAGVVGAKIGDLVAFLAENTNGGHELFLNRATSKVQYFNGTAEIANATNLSTFVARTNVVTLVNG